MPDVRAITGPGWTEPDGPHGISRYPLNVEAPVLAALDRLVPGVSPMSGATPESPLEWLTLTGRHTWPAEDRPRRASLRMLARAAQLLPEADDWQDAAEQAVGYGALLAEDPVLRELDVAASWRGVLLRRHSADAWRRWWAVLAGQPDPHEYTAEALPDVPVEEFLAGLPPATDPAGHPAPAELGATRGELIPGALGVLLIGSRRADALTGKAKAAFLADAGVYLDPGWVAHRVAAQRNLRDLGRVLVGDMLAQARRIAVLRDQPGPAPATTAAAAIPLRLNELGDLAVAQNLLFRTEDEGLGVTPLGARLLEAGP